MQTDTLKTISLNIQEDLHLDRILPFLQKHRPDVMLLQEILKKDVPSFEKSLGMTSVFTPLGFLMWKDVPQLHGIATFSKLPIINSFSAYYRGTGEHPPHLRKGEPEKMERAILGVEILNNKKSYCFLNTHFTWSPDGKPNAQQWEDFVPFLQILSDLPDFVLCGDFNAPRGTAIFETLAARYKDNIPKDVTTTIDKNLHKAGDLQLVVDGLFTTPRYQVKSIKLYDGVSDHLAVFAEVSL